MNRVLVVDDDPEIQFTLSQILMRHNYDCLLTSSGKEAVRAVRGGRVDLVLLDLFMPEMDGMETLSELKRVEPETPVIMVTGRGDIAAAVRATKLGAYDFITKPPDAEKLIQTIQKALEHSELEKSVRQLERSVEWILGRSPSMAPVLLQIRQAAASDAPVLIQGEAGTGKSVVARLIHNLSKRTGRPFFTVRFGRESSWEEELWGENEGQTPPSERRQQGLVARAGEGSIFIDGLDRMPLSVQVRLANGMERRREQPYGHSGRDDLKARLILGASREVGRLAKEKRLDEELNKSLVASPILLPPLRERLEDMRFLAGKFLWKASIEFDKEVNEIGEDVLDLLARHSWPGNIRELERVIRRSVPLSEDGVLTPDAVRFAIKNSATAIDPAGAKRRVPAGTEGMHGNHALKSGSSGELLGSGDDYRQAVMVSPVGILVHVQGKIVFANSAFAAVVGEANPESLHGRDIFDFVHADYLEQVKRRARNVVEGGEKAPMLEQKLLKTDGSVVEVEVTAFPFSHDGRDAVMVMVQDMTERKRAEKAVGTGQKELEEKTARLEEANSALKVLLSHKARDKEDLEKSILANVKKLVIPYLEKIRGSHLTESQNAYLDIAESNLNQVVSPFLQRMAAVYASFTPAEIQIASLVKEGKTTKEIAELLKVGTSTVHTHRNGIRTKLGLNNKDANLRTYLLSLED